MLFPTPALLLRLLMCRTAPAATPQIELTAEETQGASASTERQLLQLIELLVGAGAPCRAFRAEHCRTAAPAPTLLVHPSLLLAAGLLPWGPAAHHRWPPAFRHAARTLLVALRGRGVVAPPHADQDQALQRLSPAKRAWLQAGAASRTYTLPLELCFHILGKAAAHVSAWVGEA